MNLSHRLCFFPQRGLFRWEVVGILKLFFWFIVGSENMTWFWSWQRGGEEDVQCLPLFVLLCIYSLVAVANRIQLKRCIDVRIGLLAATSVLISRSASAKQSSWVRRRAWNFVPFCNCEDVVNVWQVAEATNATCATDQKATSAGGLYPRQAATQM